MRKKKTRAPVLPRSLKLVALPGKTLTNQRKKSTILRCPFGWKMEGRSFWTLQRKTRKTRKQKKLLGLPRKRGGLVRGEEGRRRSRNLRRKRTRRRRKTASKCRVDNT